MDVGKSLDRTATFLARMRPRQKHKLPRHPHVNDHLPSVDCDLAELLERIIPNNTAIPNTDGSRRDMAHQADVLRHKYRGRAEILWLHMLSISYLRRRTSHTKKAHHLFNRIWNEHGDVLLQKLGPRDLISALRTFADHCEDPSRRLLAKLGFQYATMVKIYESERKQEGLTLKQGTYANMQHVPRTAIDNLYGVAFGVDNSLEIVNMHLIEELETDPVIGPMVATIMVHIADGHSVFSRVDRARISAELALERGTGWSFGFNPDAHADETT